MKRLVNWFKNKKNLSRLRWLALAALVLSAPFSLGWVVIVSIVITIQKHWSHKMDTCRPRICALVSTLALVGCAMSTFWCSIPGFLVVTLILVSTLCFQPLIAEPKQLNSRRPAAFPYEPDGEVIDVEFWECKDTNKEDKTQEDDPDVIICTPTAAYNQRQA